MASAAATLGEGDTFERDTLPDDAHRQALLGLLGAHSVAVWGWGQRDLYCRFAMAGLSLDHWTRTSSLWAEEERDLWEWEQMLARLTDEPDGALVARTLGDLATDTVGAVGEWLDIVFLTACVDALGEELVRTLERSAYGPLQRHARLMVMFKRGQCAAGCSSIDELVAEAQVPGDVLAARAGRWLELAERHADRVSELEAAFGWVDLGFAAPLEPAPALARVTSRLYDHLKEA